VKPRTIYVRPEHADTWTDAENLATFRGEPLSALVAEGLTLVLASHARRANRQHRADDRPRRKPVKGTK
jgi:hypothetical protein